VGSHRVDGDSDASNEGAKAAARYKVTRWSIIVIMFDCVDFMFQWSRAQTRCGLFSLRDNAQRLGSEVFCSFCRTDVFRRDLLLAARS